MKFRNLVVAAAATCLFAFTSFAQITAIEGDVKGEDGMTKEQKEAYDKAIKERETSMKKNKELNDAFSAGLTALQAKDYETAVTNLTKASELDPKQVAVWAQLADAHVNAAMKKTG